MAYFPMFVDLSGKPCLIVGGGTVAARKAEKLLPFHPRLTVVAPEICSDLERLPGVTLCRRGWREEDIAGMALVIAATGDAAVNHAVSAVCQSRNIPVNVVDDREACTFLFPSLVQQGELSVGISTGGASPTAAMWVRKQVEDLLPTQFDDILAFLHRLRPLVMQRIPDERRRGAVFSTLFSACLEAGRPLEREEWESILEVSL